MEYLIHDNIKAIKKSFFFAKGMSSFENFVNECLSTNMLLEEINVICDDKSFKNKSHLNNWLEGCWM